MPEPILATKFFIPLTRSELVYRPRLIERMDEGQRHKLTLVSAPAGFGKTTLVSKWVDECKQPVAWLSLDEGDNDPARFLAYLVAALQTVMENIGEGMLVALQSPQPPPAESILTTLLNEITAIPDDFVLVLDDFHVIDAKLVDHALTYLLEHLPSQMHLVIATREDPDLPLARLRARGQLTELRAGDLRFNSSEAAEFLNQVMSLDLSAEDIDALETRTEGWIAGLQLAALALQGLALQRSVSVQGRSESANFIQAFTGSHHFVLDYLLEEVLQHQPERIQSFLLRTSILDRMSAPLCDAVLQDISTPGQEILEYLERSNLFIVPLDNERCWYRYHHLFGDLLRQRLGQGLTPEAIAEDHIRASQWYENNGLVFEAFHHATTANDVERAERLIENKAMPLHFHSVAMGVVDWLTSLPKTILDARPWLWVKSCTLALMAGQTTGVEERLQAAEKALQNNELDDKIRDQIGQIACARATLALTRYQPEEMIIQARRALEYLHPSNLVFRFTANWALASACLLQGDRTEAYRASMEGLSISQKSGDIFSTILATGDLGQIQELENHLYPAAEAYRRILQLSGEHPLPNTGEACLGLARICYEWNDLEAAEEYGQQSLQLMRQYDRVIDRFILAEVFLARLKLAQGDVATAADMLAQTEQTARQKNFVLRMPEIAAAQVLVMLQQGKLGTAAALAQQLELPLSQARVFLVQGDPSAALSVLISYRQQMEARGWQDECLKAMVLQSVALRQSGEDEKALNVLAETLTLAKPGGFVRIFVDEGELMAQLLSEAAAQGMMPDYTSKLLAAFSLELPKQTRPSLNKLAHPDPLSGRELEVLQHIAEGLTNQEIAAQLYLSLYTVKAHARNIFGKLDVTNRTQAVARARELGILQQG